jgi:hypothetical protein
MCCAECRYWHARHDTERYLRQGADADPDAVPEWQSAHDRRLNAEADAEEFTGTLHFGDLPWVALPGECRRHAPHFPAGWPMAGADDFCGEFAAKTGEKLP